MNDSLTAKPTRRHTVHPDNSNPDELPTPGTLYQVVSFHRDNMCFEIEQIVPKAWDLELVPVKPKGKGR